MAEFYSARGWEIPPLPWTNLSPPFSISHRSLQVETPEEVADDIRRVLELIDAGRLILSSDCGFGRQGLSRKHAFYKMVSLVRGANIVRRELGLDEVSVLAEQANLSCL